MNSILKILKYETQMFKTVLHANFWTIFWIKLSHVTILKTNLNFALHRLARWIQAMRKCSGAWTRWSRKIRHWELRFLSVVGHLAQKHRTLDLWFQQHKTDPHSSHRQLSLSGNTVSMESTSIGSIQMVKSKGISSAHFSSKFLRNSTFKDLSSPTYLCLLISS